MIRHAHIRRLWMLVSVCAALGGILPASAAAYSDVEALADLNAWRTETGVAPVTGVNARGSAACAAHNNYMAANHSLTHTEEGDHPGYSSDGDYAGSSSVLAGIGPGATPAPRATWEEAVYHRQQLLEPRLKTTWFAADVSWACMGVLDLSFQDGEQVPAIDDSPTNRTPQLVAYPSPANGVTGVPTSFRTHETPDPREVIPGNPEEPGWLLSIDFNGPWDLGLQATPSLATLTPDGGSPVAVTAVGTPAHVLYGDIGVFPNAALTPHTWYTAHVAGTKVGRSQDPNTGRISDTTYPFDVTWRFQTGVRRVYPWERQQQRNQKPTPEASRAMKLAVSGTLRGRRLKVSVRAGEGARARPATMRIFSLRRRCHGAAHRRRCRRGWVRVSSRRMTLTKAITRRGVAASATTKRLRVTVSVAGYRTADGSRYRATTARRVIYRR